MAKKPKKDKARTELTATWLGEAKRRARQQARDCSLEPRPSFAYHKPEGVFRGFRPTPSMRLAGRPLTARLTERQWLACSDPTTMLAFLAGKTSNRKVRLFGCACLRHTPRLIAEQDENVRIAERFADGDVSLRAMTAIEEYAGITQADVAEAAYEAMGLASGAVGSDVWNGAMREGKTRTDANKLQRTAFKHEETYQAALLRDIVGNPFRPVTIDPRWLGWDGGVIVNLAGAIYDERTFDRLPILADALEDAGCTNGDILEHCRAGGAHARGCWVLDLILGKEKIGQRKCDSAGDGTEDPRKQGKKRARKKRARRHRASPGTSPAPGKA